MKSTRKKSLVLICLLLALCLLLGCAQTSSEPQESATSGEAQTDQEQPDNGTESAGKPEQVTLEFMAFAPETNFNDFDKVLEAVYEKTDDILNIRIHYTFTTIGEIGQKVSLKIASGEQLDLCFVAPWTNPTLNQMVSKEMLLNLDSYFDSPEYPALGKLFDEEYLRNNSFADASGEYHVYAVPFGQSFVNGNCLYYRLDLAKKYGIGEIKTLEQLTQFYDAIVENEPGMMPLCMNAGETVVALFGDVLKPLQTENHNYATINSVGVAVGEDGKAYAAKTWIPNMDATYYSMLDEDLQAQDPLHAYTVAREWYQKGYVTDDCLTQSDHEGQFVAGRAASFKRAVDTYNSINARLVSSVQGAELGCLPLEPGAYYDTPLAAGSDFKTWNFAGIPTTSEYADRTMGFLNWLFESKENHDLMELGIEGVHWEAVGEDYYRIPEGVDPAKNYNFYGYLLTWNPNYVRYLDTTPEFIVDLYKKYADTSFIYKKVEAGFSFMTDPVKSEQALMNDLTSLGTPLGNGMVEDIPGEIERIQAQYDAAGFQTIVAEVERQFNEFLLENPYEGQ